ncbi:MAG: ATP-binding cassette domain-containing protein, partial [Candidatus Omnitrophota bacterium]
MTEPEHSKKEKEILGHKPWAWSWGSSEEDPKKRTKKRKDLEKEEVIIEVKDLVKRFGDRTVLNGVDLKVHKGEIFVIMGGSGCGKSTLLRHMIGSLKADSGRVVVLGEDITDL